MTIKTAILPDLAYVTVEVDDCSEQGNKLLIYLQYDSEQRDSIVYAFATKTSKST